MVNFTGGLLQIGKRYIPTNKINEICSAEGQATDIYYGNNDENCINVSVLPEEVAKSYIEAENTNTFVNVYA